MEELEGHQGAGLPPPPFPPFSKVSVQVYTVPSSSTTAAAADAAGGARQVLSGTVASAARDDGDRGYGGRVVGVLDPVKARIVSHPRYHHLLAVFLDCHKVGCLAEAAEEIAAAARVREARQRAAASHMPPAQDPELDQFMEDYCKLLVECKEELSRPLQEAEEFLGTVESELNSINSGPPHTALISEQVIRKFWTPYNTFGLTIAEDKAGLGSSNDEHEDGSGMEMEAEEDRALVIDPRSNKELKRQLLKKYRGYLGSLRKELSKKTNKKGKIPKEARQKLLTWWELHYRWPYPSEMEKIALAESTGLEQKQINNWFINQRKRHWKPSEMQFTVMEAYHHPQNANAAAPAAAVDPTRADHGVWYA